MTLKKITIAAATIAMLAAGFAAALIFTDDNRNPNTNEFNTQAAAIHQVYTKDCKVTDVDDEMITVVDTNDRVWLFSCENNTLNTDDDIIVTFDNNKTMNIEDDIITGYKTI